ncbi:polysaccharide deacetylase family protein [Planctomycetota bacterium]|nr:polysaccharide deacetylase family protein [Planctomycetota bacterium]
MLRGVSIKLLFLTASFACWWFLDAPTSYIASGAVLALMVGVIAWGVFHPNSPLWAYTYFRSPTESNAVALTFDDGPDPDFTPKILEILEQKDVKAAFFVIGEKAQKAPGVLRQIADSGHVVGNHSHTHDTMINIFRRKKLKTNILGCSAVIEDLAGVKARMYRPPFGFKNPATGDVLNDLGMICIGWQARGFDGVGVDAETLTRRILAKVKPGGVLLLHDGAGPQGESDRSSTLEALPRIIDGLRERGLTLERLDKLLQQEAYLG